MKNYDDDKDPYSYPDTDTLRNKVGIRDAETLAQYEYKKVAERSLELQENPIKGEFDLKHLQDIHKHLFQDEYEWTGEIRTTTLSKGGSAFAFPDMIERYANICEGPALRSTLPDCGILSTVCFVEPTKKHGDSPLFH